MEFYVEICQAVETNSLFQKNLEIAENLIRNYFPLSKINKIPFPRLNSFEIYCDNDQIWSKLKTNHFPTKKDLNQKFV